MTGIGGRTRGGPAKHRLLREGQKKTRDKAVKAAVIVKKMGTRFL